MSTDKTTPVVIENANNSENPSVVTADSPAKNPEPNLPQHFLKLAKQFAIDGALVPVDNQSPIEERANKRSRFMDIRKQKNIENIMKKSLGYCDNADVNHRADHDWFSHYIHLAEGISNQTMQDLWAKILTGELSKPGSFSLKALKVFREMSILDAKLLAKACSLAVQDQNQKNRRLISGVYLQPGLWNFFSKHRQQYINLSHFGLNHADLLALAENHLIYIQESELNLATSPEKLTMNYNGIAIHLTAKKNNTNIQFYKFTPIGTELARLITDKPNPDFLAYLKKQLSLHFNLFD